jgi:hypothetical protein
LTRPVGTNPGSPGSWATSKLHNNQVYVCLLVVDAKHQDKVVLRLSD